MGGLKKGSLGPQGYINMKNRWKEIPAVLGKRLMVDGGLILCVLLAGSIMENLNPGEGFLKLTLLCAFVFGVRWCYLLSVCYWKQYTVEDGMAEEVWPPQNGKRCCRVEMACSDRKKQVEIPAWIMVQKGRQYRCYWREGALLGIEPLQETREDSPKISGIRPDT